MKRLLLVCGGHAHLPVLQELAQDRLTDIDGVLVALWRWQDRSSRGAIARHSNSGRRRDTLLQKEAT